jgi:CubicO group peptidase (beta-lactamase class C family)
MYKMVRYWTPNIDEYNAFPQAKISSGEEKFHFPVAIDTVFNNLEVTKVLKGDTLRFTIDEFAAKSKTTAYLIIKNDTVIYERYYRGYDRSKISTFFSTTKSITSLLTGIAVDEGYIKSVHDPVTDYVPEFKEGDPRFQKLTIEHLLNMQAGLDFTESYSNPFEEMAKLFYGKNQLEQLKNLKFVRDPGEKYAYNSATTAILGVVLERATNKPYAEYLQEKVWIPLGMEYDASVSLDDKKHRSAKAYYGLNATAIDLAKIGRLYMNGGNWNGKQIVSKEWVEKSTTPNISEDHVGGEKYEDYQYCWYSTKRNSYERNSTGAYLFNDSISALHFAEDSALVHYEIRKIMNIGSLGYHWRITDFTPEFNTFGIMGQVLFVDPERKVIVVRLGEEWSDEYNTTWLARIIAQRRYPVLEEKW